MSEILKREKVGDDTLFPSKNREIMEKMQVIVPDIVTVR